MPEVTVMMVPAPRSIRCGVNASMTRMVPRRLVSIVCLRGAEVRGIAQVLGDPDPGHRHDRVEARVAAEDRVAGTVDAGGVGHVDGNGGEPLSGEFAEQVGSSAADDDVAAGRGEAAGELEADPRGSAGDEDGAVGDVHCLLLLRAPDSDELVGAVDDGLGYRPGPSMRGCARSSGDTFSVGLFSGRRQYPRLPGSRQGPLSRGGPELRC